MDNEVPESPTPPQPAGSPLERLKAGLLASPAETVAFSLRGAVVLFTVVALVFATSSFGSTAYYQALFCFGLASIVRLYQRCGAPKFSSDYLRNVLVEDSAHYVLYSLVFFGGAPSPAVLLSPSIYAFFAACTFFRKSIAPAISPRLEGAVKKIESSASKGFTYASNIEIGVFFLLLFRLITGPGFHELVILYMYIQFCMLRTTSRRNAYPRAAWAAVRANIERIVNSPRCPGIVRTLYQRVLQGIAAYSEQRQAPEHQQ
eukprot:m.160770 g.160770  ORF g.160770 m.160770 type:complete len:260 (+) comp9851_c2_seq1:51-830(+)